MRTFFKIALSYVLILLGASCAKQDLQPEPPKKDNPGQESGMTFSLVAETCVDSEGKNVLGGTDISWSEGDKIGIWDGEALCVFTAVKQDGKFVFTGTASEADTYWAVYPWTEGLSVDASGATPVFNSSVPSDQQACKGSFASGASLAIGKSIGSSKVIQMKNVCGFFKFNFPEAQINAQKPGSLNRIVLTSLAGTKISGALSFTLDGSGVPSVVSAPKATGDETITFGFDEELPEAGATYYFCALPADLGSADGGIKLAFSRSGDCAVASKSGGAGKSNVLARNTVLNLGPIVPDWTPVDGEEPDDTTPDPTGSFDYSLLSGTSHPKVYMTDEDFRVLKKYLAEGSYPILSEVSARVVSYAEAILGRAIPTEAEYRTQYPNYTDHNSGDWYTYKSLHRTNIAAGANNRLINDAYAYRITGDEKFLTDAIKVFDQLCEDPDWCPDNGLSMAETALGFGIAYDWLYYDLSLEERTKIRANIISKALNAKKNYATQTNVGQVNNAGMMAALVAIYEKGKTAVKDEIEKSLTGNLSIVNNMYGATGSTFEGYGYWNYGNTFQTIYNEILLTAFGTDKGIGEVAGFKSTGKFMLYLSDHLEPFKYSDGGSSSVAIQPALWWFAAHYQSPSFLANDIYLQNKKPSSGSGRTMFIMPCVLAKYAPLDLSQVSAPSSDIFVDSNSSKSPVLMVRTGWTNTERDKYLGLKAGVAKVNHGHMDVGSFAYHANGKVWSTDVGHKAYYVYTSKGAVGTTSQTSPGWRPLAYNAMGHSTICFVNYSGSTEKTYPTDHLITAKSTILESYDTAEQKGGKIDLTPLFVGQVTSATRKAVIYKDAYLKIEDEITALSGEDAQLVWRLVTPASVAIVDDLITLTQGADVMYLSLVSSNPAIAITPHNWGDFADARPGTEFGWEAEKPAWDESHPGNYITGFTLTIPKGTSVTLTTTLSPFAPGSKEAGTTAETPGFGDDNYNW